MPKQREAHREQHDHLYNADRRTATRACRPRCSSIGHGQRAHAIERAPVALVEQAERDGDSMPSSMNVTLKPGHVLVERIDLGRAAVDADLLDAERRRGNHGLRQTRAAAPARRRRRRQARRARRAPRARRQNAQLDVDRQLDRRRRLLDRALSSGGGSGNAGRIRNPVGTARREPLKLREPRLELAARRGQLVEVRARGLL